jgi:hypothetical protein
MNTFGTAQRNEYTDWAITKVIVTVILENQYVDYYF